MPLPKDSSRAAEKPKKRRRISTHGGPGHPGEISIPSTPPAEDGTTIETAGRLLQDVGGGRLGEYQVPYRVRVFGLMFASIRGRFSVSVLPAEYAEAG